MDMVLIILGAIVAIIGYVWLLVACFGESVLWGVGGLFCGLVALVFGVMNWGELKVPTSLYVVGSVLLAIGQAIQAS